jgi:uncharacterized membrane protein YeaQ/YmgE (transglycosylase-associated protein family)
MNVLLTLLVGIFIGAVGKMVLMPGRDQAGFVVTMLLGVAGAALAGFIGRSLGMYHAGDAGPRLLASFIGAVVVLAIFRLLSPRKMAAPR